MPIMQQVSEWFKDTFTLNGRVKPDLGGSHHMVAFHITDESAGRGFTGRRMDTVEHVVVGRLHDVVTDEKGNKTYTMYFGVRGDNSQGYPYDHFQFRVDPIGQMLAKDGHPITGMRLSMHRAHPSDTSGVYLSESMMTPDGTVEVGRKYVGGVNWQQGTGYPEMRKLGATGGMHEVARGHIVFGEMWQMHKPEKAARIQDEWAEAVERAQNAVGGSWVGGQVVYNIPQDRGSQVKKFKLTKGKHAAFTEVTGVLLSEDENFYTVFTPVGKQDAATLKIRKSRCESVETVPYEEFDAKKLGMKVNALGRRAQSMRSKTEYHAFKRG